MNKKMEFDPNTRKRITEHYSNENDVITDADIQNVITNVYSGITPQTKPVPVEKLSDTELKNETNNNDSGVETPWNILNSNA